MEVIDKFLVTVKVSELLETGKTKNSKEVYLVTDVATPQQAADLVQKEYADSVYDWQIESVKAQKIDAILTAK